MSISKFNNPDFIQDVIKLWEQGKVNLEIAQILDVSPTTVRKCLRSLNKEENSIKNKQLKTVNLTKDQLEIIYGSLLGDMSISLTKNLARLSINQGGKQESYFDHKCEKFLGLLGKPNKTPRYDKRTKKHYNRYAVRSLAHKIYLDIYNVVYLNGKKTVNSKWLDEITPQSLAYWYMDDGAEHGVIATNSFSLEEIELLQTMLNDKFNIRTRLYKMPNVEQYVIKILAEDRFKFFKLVEPYIIPSMLYKFRKKA